ncbi:hypothetical protein, partial [Lyngbya sp. CCY1209]|uniref:hypothetical protein n=1 Tax=Lyngbya sp. CCY1209 TaxID=2886103 RepID=UPI002D216119
MATPQFEHSRQPALEGESSVDVTLTDEMAIADNSNDRLATTSKPPARLRVPKGFWGWQLLWLIVLLGFGTTATGALLWLLTTPPPPNCEEISALSPSGDRLYCADRATKSGELKDIQAAFALVQSWPEDHPLQTQAKQMMREWSKRLIVYANQKIDAGDLQGALAMVAVVPKDSPAYAEVERAIAGWKNDWDDGQRLADRASEALKYQNWDQAFHYIQALSKLNNIHWSEKRHDELLDRMGLEKQGEQRLKEARNIAKRSTPSNLSEAIALAKRIDPQLYVFAVAQDDIKNWGRDLLNLAVEATEEDNFQKAIEIAQLIPSDSPFYPEAQDVIVLTQIQRVSSDRASGGPFLYQIATLIEGRAALDKIAAAPDGIPEIYQPVYEEAKTQMDRVSGQVQDLVSLQLASAVAKVGHPWALQLAIDQAGTIAPDRPRRIHAQTLVAHWRKEVQRIEDRPYIAVARELARTETVDGFRAAVAYAREVELGRPLRIEAQTLIAEWTKRIEIIEDQPLLNEALALAGEDNLSGAIDKASEIKPGRALYAEAQDKIAGWVSEIQIAQDQPFLDRAYDLAGQGSLSAAISEASRIGYGRALYYEAQNAIARWAAERDAIWAAQQQRRGSYASSRDEPSGYSDNSGYSGYSDNSGYSGYSDNSGYSGYS